MTGRAYRLAVALVGVTFIAAYIVARCAQDSTRLRAALAALCGHTVVYRARFVERLLDEERPKIEEEIRKALRRNAGAMAQGIADSLADRAAKGYGVTVSLKLPGDYA